MKSGKGRGLLYIIICKRGWGDFEHEEERVGIFGNSNNFVRELGKRIDN
jgi:hypothetical protein